MFDRIPPLVDGCDLPKEPATLLRTLVANPSQSPERELDLLATLERPGHLIENELDNTDRIPAGQAPLAQLVNQIGTAQILRLAFHHCDLLNSFTTTFLAFGSNECQTTPSIRNDPGQSRLGRYSSGWGLCRA